MSEPIPDYFDLPLRQFVEDSAAGKPTPGGGSVTSMSAVLGVSLARMAAAYTLGNAKLADVHDRVRELDSRLAEADGLFRRMVVEDMEAYLAYVEARKTVDTPEFREQRRQATLAVVAVPTEITALASATLKACDELKDVASSYLLSDLLAAAHLLHGACQAAAVNARLNLKNLTDDRLLNTYRAQITGALSHAELHLASIRAAINEKLALPS
ncbi:MAG: cyclodeaminase/cyclohydrolase family protein [Phycisphaerales bacterium]|nr:MAG: cyclodeaminase/cyclohydrolase family protein [Phycisphaerales bacterium]